MLLLLCAELGKLTFQSLEALVELFSTGAHLGHTLAVLEASVVDAKEKAKSRGPMKKKVLERLLHLQRELQQAYVDLREGAS